MGVKSTVFLTREEAEQLYKELYGQVNDIPIPKKDEDLAYVLAGMNDAVHDGEGFDNYWIEEK